MTICGLTVVFARLFVLMAVTSWNHEKVTLQVVWPVSSRNTDIFTRLKITWTTCFCFLGGFLQVILKVLVGWLCYWIGFTSFKSYYSAAIFKKKKKRKTRRKKMSNNSFNINLLTLRPAFLSAAKQCWYMIEHSILLPFFIIKNITYVHLVKTVVLHSMYSKCYQHIIWQ